MPQPMSRAAIDEAAALLAEARLANAVIPGLPEACRPRSLGDAYAIQDALAARLGWETAGWFCACTNAEIQRMLGLDEPYYARLFSRQILPSGAIVRTDEFPPIVLECEIGFRLARDLPARPVPFSREEVAAAIGSVHPTIEIVAGHLADWPKQDVFSVIADNGTDGALVVGEGVVDWGRLDLPALRAELRVGDKIERAGEGRNVLGDPLGAFVWLAEARRKAGDGLRAGHVHNTGTLTPVFWAPRQGDVVADFGALGTVELKLR